MEKCILKILDFYRLVYHRTSLNLTKHIHALNLWVGEFFLSGITIKECFREHRLAHSAPDYFFRWNMLRLINCFFFYVFLLSRWLNLCNAGMPHCYGNIESKVFLTRDVSFHLEELNTRFLKLNLSEVENMLRKYIF